MNAQLKPEAPVIAIFIKATFCARRLTVTLCGVAVLNACLIAQLSA